jgi:FkbM family methyltransferase
MKKYIARLIVSLIRSPRACLRKLYANDIDAQVWRKCKLLEGTVLLHPKNIVGTFMADIRSHIALRILLTDEYEPAILASIIHYKTRIDQQYTREAVIVNIGANIGLVAVHLARQMARKVIAIEPNKEAYNLLTQNIERNDLQDVIRSVQVCVGENEGALSFFTIPGKPEYSSINGIVEPSVKNENQVANLIPVLPLTQIVSEKVALMFVDVEGAEELVFKGAESIIIRDHPFIVSECSTTLLKKFGSSTKKIYEFFLSSGYTIFDMETGAELTEEFQFATFNGNIIALPPHC